MTIHSTAIIYPKAKLGQNVKISAFCIIYDNVEIGDDTEIGPYCEIGVSNHRSNGRILKIGKNSLIRSHSVLYEGSEFGEQLITGHRATIREGTIAGINLQVGTLCDLQGDSEFGDYVRLHSNVFIAQKCKIGSFVWIFPYVVITDDPRPPSNNLVGSVIDNFAVIAAKSLILPDTHVSEGCLIGAHSTLKGKTDPHSIYIGTPAKKIGSVERLKLDNGKPAYPWTTHFKRGYPDSITRNW